MSSVLTFPLETGAFPLVVYALGIVTVVILAVTKRPRRRWLPIQLAGGVLGFGAGYLIAWLVSDVWNSFDAELSPTTFLWFGLGLAGIGFAIAGIPGSRGLRLAHAISAVAVFALVLAVGVNSDVAEIPTLASAFGADRPSALELPIAAHDDLPSKGTIGEVTIPATVSHFAARKAIVYLPPAALVRNPQRLPVLEMLSGQPGQPLDVIRSGALAMIFDAYARQHNGLAPIVVIPDQLGAPDLNPMCVDSPEGDSATYLTVDVPHWIEAHLRVLTARTDWAIGGFSQGGTCSAQLGGAHPALYGSILDISGQAVPRHGSIASTVAQAFGGSQKAFAAAAPGAVLAAHAPYADTLGLFFVGADDTRYGHDSVTVSRAARKAGMTVHFAVSPGSGHDWRTVHFALRRALPELMTRWGLR
ncbi:alpha/beta hydrolase-fold protein [soil metagenome]